MSSYNRLAIYGHRGWASSAITDALIASGAPVKILYRPGSDVSEIPSGVETVEIDLENTQALIEALKDVDIVISLTGHQGIKLQHEFVKAIPSTSVKLFSPSDLAYKLDEQQAKIPNLGEKFKVEQAAKDAGIPVTAIRPGNFIESTFAVPLLGIDVAGNKLVHSGDSEIHPLVLCSRTYVAAAYAAIFARTPISQIQNRSIALCELLATGGQIAAALERKHGVAPTLYRQSVEHIREQVQIRSERGEMLALPYAYRHPWAVGTQRELVGSDIWDVEGVEKGDLEKYIVRGEGDAYREFPPAFMDALRSTFY